MIVLALCASGQIALMMQVTCICICKPMHEGQCSTATAVPATLPSKPDQLPIAAVSLLRPACDRHGAQPTTTWCPATPAPSGCTSAATWRLCGLQTCGEGPPSPCTTAPAAAASMKHARRSRCAVKPHALLRRSTLLTMLTAWAPSWMMHRLAVCCMSRSSTGSSCHAH